MAYIDQANLKWMEIQLPVSLNARRHTALHSPWKLFLINILVSTLQGIYTF